MLLTGYFLCVLPVTTVKCKRKTLNAFKTLNNNKLLLCGNKSLIAKLNFSHGSTYLHLLIFSLCFEFLTFL